MTLKELRELDEAAYDALYSFWPIDQAQYGTREQLEVLMLFAIKLGLYDAHDHIKKSLSV